MTPEEKPRVRDILRRLNRLDAVTSARVKRGTEKAVLRRWVTTPREDRGKRGGIMVAGYEPGPSGEIGERPTTPKQ